MLAGERMPVQESLGIQSEVSQKEKNKYRMLTLVYGILKKMVLMNLVTGQE